MQNKKPLSQFTKDELRFMEKHRCEHRHTFLEHRECYDAANFNKERIGFLDIECSDLDPSHGVVYTYCIKDADSKKIYFDVMSKADIAKWSSSGKEDTRVLRNLVRDMGNFDRIVTHYGARFDLPYIRTRSLVCGIPFPSYGAYAQTDTWQILKTKFRAMRSKSLKNACQVFFGTSDKTSLHGKYTRGAIRCEKWALDYILKHNKIDVLETEKLYNLIRPYIKEMNSSI